MKLLTAKDLKNLPALYATEDIEDPIAQVKLFHPLGGATWFLTEYNPDTKIGFGLAHIQETELGYISIEELQNLNLGGLGVERDTSFKPKKLSEARQDAGL